MRHGHTIFCLNDEVTNTVSPHSVRLKGGGKGREHVSERYEAKRDAMLSSHNLHFGSTMNGYEAGLSDLNFTEDLEGSTTKTSIAPLVHGRHLERTTMVLAIELTPIRLSAEKVTAKLIITEAVDLTKGDRGNGVCVPQGGGAAVVKPNGQLRLLTPNRQIPITNSKTNSK